MVRIVVWDSPDEDSAARVISALESRTGFPNSCLYRASACEASDVATRSNRYKEAFAATTEVVNRHDPIGLIEIGAPDDEYDPEVGDLVRMVLRNDPIEESDVEGVWIRWFGDTYRMGGSNSLAAMTRDLRGLQARFARRQIDIEGLPASIREQARIYDNGEVAWPREAAAEAVEALGHCGNLILGLDFRRDEREGIFEAPWASIEPRERTADEVRRTVAGALEALTKGLNSKDLRDFPWVLVTWEPSGVGRARSADS